MHRSFTSFLFLVAILALSLSVVSQPAMAQYSVKTLVSNTPTSTTSHTDPNLINAWGLARSAGSAFWVSDNATGVSTLYNGIGIPQSLIVSIPSADPAVSGAPTGIVFNGTQQFTVQENGGPGSPSIFLFATLDGTISGWNPTINLDHAVLAADNSAAHSVYTGLAISDPTSTVQFLYAADIANNRVDVYDSSFKIVNHLTDPTIPAGFAPYGIQDINGKVYVTFATNAPTGGFVDVFSEAGILLQRLVRNSQILNQPWGLALAPRNFGPFSGALLVGNNTPDGRINAFDVHTGAFLGQLKDASGKALSIDQLWGLSFGGGTPNNGATNELFFTAGPNEYANGRFGAIHFTGRSSLGGGGTQP